MQTYEIEICRTSSRSKKFTIKVKDGTQPYMAEEEAMKRAMHTNFNSASEGLVEYEVTNLIWK